MVLTQKTLDDILGHVENSVSNLVKEAFENFEIDEGVKGIENFLQNQFDVRLENLLVAKNCSIHHLESGMKNAVIQRKRKMLEEIFNRYKN